MSIPDGPIDTEPRMPSDRLYRSGHGPMTDELRALLVREDAALILDELEAAGVELGDHDRRIIAWLAGWEYSTLVTIASWIKRAHAAGQEASR